MDVLVPRCRSPVHQKGRRKKNTRKVKNLETVDMIKTTADVLHHRFAYLLFGCANAEPDFETLCHVFSYQLTCLYGVFSNTGDKNSMFSISIPSMKKSSWYLELCAVWPHVHCKFYHVKGAKLPCHGIKKTDFKKKYLSNLFPPSILKWRGEDRRWTSAPCKHNP